MIFRRKRKEKKPLPTRTDEDHEHEQMEAAELQDRLDVARKRLVRLETDLLKRSK